MPDADRPPHGAKLPPLLLRADASVEVGAGHVMRCLALAQAWRDSGGEAVFAGAMPHALADRVSGEFDSVVDLDVEPGSDADARETISVADEVAAAWVVTDGYAFGEAFQARVRAAGKRLLVIDDYGHAERYHADIILNQNITADPGLYSRGGGDAELLLGTEFILLRREFTAGPQRPRRHPREVKRVLLTFGGSDPLGMAPTALRALLEVPGDPFEYRVVIGSLGGNQAELARLAEGRRVTILRDVENMPEQLVWADLMIGAAGSTCWEAAFFELPMVLMVVAENQRRVAQKLADHGAAVVLEDQGATALRRLRENVANLRTDLAGRRSLGATAHRLVDGGGARRVVIAMQQRLS